MPAKQSLLAISALLISSTLFAHPTFQDYPAQTYTGKNHAVVLNKETRLYKTLMTELSKQPVNFAGHYGIETYGCGGGCVAGLLYDAKTGATAYLPDSFRDCYSEQYGFSSREIKFKADSRLLIGTGSRKGDHEQCELVYYLIENGRFKELESYRINNGQNPWVNALFEEWNKEEN
jgi:hypothetical protein